MTFLLIPPYLIFAFFVIRAVLKKQFTHNRKWQMGLLTAFLLYLPLGWDVILGRTVFYTLCATQGGIHVYQTVELGPEYWGENGEPRFFYRDLGFNEINIVDRYLGRRNTNSNYSKTLNLSITKYEVVDTEKNSTLGLYVKYTYFGGWFMNYTGFHVVGNSCPSSKNLDNDLVQLTQSVFVKAR
ncbi:MAG: hypothetical protein OQK73_07410 [Gammaproteobacteria bacterium]|nr:hypothetical protein [Gammaproteobacteria bacterium]